MTLQHTNVKTFCLKGLHWVSLKNPINKTSSWDQVLNRFFCTPLPIMLWAISLAPCYVTVENGRQHSLLTEATDWLLGQLHLSNHIPAIVVSQKVSPMPSLLPKCLLVLSLSFLSASFVKTKHFFSKLHFHWVLSAWSSDGVHAPLFYDLTSSLSGLQRGRCNLTSL